MYDAAHAAGPAVRSTGHVRRSVKLPDNLVAEIVDGELHASPKPAPAHVIAGSSIGALIANPYSFGRGGPGGWWILDEPELHLGPDVLVPDLAGWKRERMPQRPDTVYFPLAPDWVCEVLSPSTTRLDRTRKLGILRARTGGPRLVDRSAGADAGGFRARGRSLDSAGRPWGRGNRARRAVRRDRPRVGAVVVRPAFAGVISPASARLSFESAPRGNEPAEGQTGLTPTAALAGTALPRPSRHRGICNRLITGTRIGAGLPAGFRRAPSAPVVHRSVDQEGRFFHHGGVMEERQWPR